VVIRISPNRVNLANARLEQATLKDCAATKQSITSSSPTTTIDLSLGNLVYLSHTINTTVAVTNPSASGTTCRVAIYRTQAGGSTITWPTTFRWPNNAAPTLSATSGTVDVIEAVTNNGGSIWYASSLTLDVR
jgi:hypothetical protein